MPKHNPPPPAGGLDEDAETAPQWLTELYADSDDEMPSEALDQNILQAAAKKAEHLPESPRGMRPSSRWVGAIASAAVLMMTVSVFLSGGVSDPVSSQVDSQTPKMMFEMAPQAEQEALQGKSVARKSLPEAPVSSEAPFEQANSMLLQDADEQTMLQSIHFRTRMEHARKQLEREYEARSAAGAFADAESTYSVDDIDGRANSKPEAKDRSCDTVTTGICGDANGVIFVRHPGCAQPFKLLDPVDIDPEFRAVTQGAPLATKDAVKVVTKIERLLASPPIQCVDGAWVATPD